MQCCWNSYTNCTTDMTSPGCNWYGACTIAPRFPMLQSHAVHSGGMTWCNSVQSSEGFLRSRCAVVIRPSFGKTAGIKIFSQKLSQEHTPTLQEKISQSKTSCKSQTFMRCFNSPCPFLPMRKWNRWKLKPWTQISRDKIMTHGRMFGGGLNSEQGSTMHTISERCKPTKCSGGYGSQPAYQK